MEKTVKPLEIVEALAKAIREELAQHIGDPQDTAQVGEVADPVAPVQTVGFLSGQEPTHLDAVDHHASLSVAQFHAGHEELSKAHRELAVAHSNVAGLNAEQILNAAYGQFEGMEVPSDFIPHGMDAQLEKKAPSFEAFDDASGVGVDKKHVGKTPDDQKSKLVNDPQKDDVKPEVKKEETSDSETAEKREVDEKLVKPCSKADADGSSSTSGFAASEDSDEETAQKDEAQDFVSKEIAHLIRDKGFSPDRAKGAAYSIARDKGYKVGKTEEENIAAANLMKANESLLAHQLGLFKAEPIFGGANSPLGSGQMGQKVDRSGKPLPAPTATPTPPPIAKEESEESSESEESVEKAGEFKSKQVQNIRQAKGYTRARPQMKDEDADQKLDGKGRPDGDPKSAVLHKDKKDGTK